jgi:hypothetical protein
VEKSEEQGLEPKDQVINVIERLNEKWEHRFTLDNPRLVENYLERKFHFLVLIEETGKTGHQFVALFQRALSELAVGDDIYIETTKTEINVGRNFDPFVFGDTSQKRALEKTRHGDVRNLSASSYQEAVLVDVVKLVKSPETVIPSLVRFGSVNSIFGRLRHSLYFSFTRGFVIGGTVRVDYGESDLLALGLGKGNALGGLRSVLERVMLWAAQPMSTRNQARWSRALLSCWRHSPATNGIAPIMGWALTT